MIERFKIKKPLWKMQEANLLYQNKQSKKSLNYLSEIIFIKK